ncbi:hypothetical protein ACUY4R_001151 [Kosakonia sp. BK9b]|uniref:hypothetical protein n=1 Tax=Kosakonia sp. TaxID=1916651 RepID=UPI0028995977|nr:hypothetical protein [Kosakonia sp.]
MKNGCYRIQHEGIVQIAWFTSDGAEEAENVASLTGIWRLTEGYDIHHGDTVKVLEGPLTEPHV